MEKNNISKLFVTVFLAISVILMLSVQYTQSILTPETGVYLSLFVTITILFICYYLWLKIKNESIVNIFVIISCYFLLSFGIFVTNVSYSATNSFEHLYKNYIFNIDLDPPNVRITYLTNSFDFSKSEGRIVFDVIHLDSSPLSSDIWVTNGKTVRVYVPENMQLDCENLLNQNLDCEKTSDRSIEIKNFTGTKLEIKYSGRMYPIGKFILDVTSKKVDNNRIAPTMNFSLEGYGCDNPCFSGINSEINKEGNLITVHIPKEYYDSETEILHQEVTLNTFSIIQRNNIDFYKNVGLGLIISSIFLYLEFFLKTLRYILPNQITRKSDK